MSYMLNNANVPANEKQTQPEYGPPDAYAPPRQYFPTPTQPHMLPTQTLTHTAQLQHQTLMPTPMAPQMPQMPQTQLPPSQMPAYGAPLLGPAPPLIADPYLPMQPAPPPQQTDLALYAYGSQPAFTSGTLPLPAQAQMVQGAYAVQEVHPAQAQFAESVGPHHASAHAPQKFHSLVDPLSYSPYGDYSSKYVAAHPSASGTAYSMLPPLTNLFSQQNPAYQAENRPDTGIPQPNHDSTSSLGLLSLFAGTLGGFGSTLALSDPSQGAYSGAPETGRGKRQRRHTASVSQMTPETAARNRCSICNKQFKRPLSLQTHYYLHTGQKLFKCAWPDCGKLFLVKSNMTRHYKIHERDVKVGKTAHAGHFVSADTDEHGGSVDFDRAHSYKGLE